MAGELNGPEFDIAPYMSDYSLNIAMGKFKKIKLWSDYMI